MCSEFSPFMCLDDIKFGLGAGWPPFGKELLIRLTICSLCTVCTCIFGFNGMILVLIAPVPGHCQPFTSLPQQRLIL